MDWKTWLQQFDRWENATAAYSEEVLRSPLLLSPLGRMMTAAFQAKIGFDQALQHWWSFVGLPTRGEQERILHALNQLESRLYDLEERLAAGAHTQADGAQAASPAEGPVLRRSKEPPPARSRAASGARPTKRGKGRRGKAERP